MELTTLFFFPISLIVSLFQLSLSFSLSLSLSLSLLCAERNSLGIWESRADMKNASDVRLSQIPSITDEDLYQLTKVHDD